MFRYGTYIFGGRGGLYVVVDDGAYARMLELPRPMLTFLEFMDFSLNRAESPSN